MTGLTESERALTRRALALAGCGRYSAAVLADAQRCLADMARLAGRLDGRITHLVRQLEDSHRPAGWTEAERDAYRAVCLERDRLAFRLELADDGPVRYSLTEKAQAELAAQDRAAS